MNPRNCTVKHNPPDSYGDCIRACIATLIDRDDVPHVFANGDSDPLASWQQLRAWLKEQKRTIFFTSFEEEPFEFMKFTNPDIYYMMICTSAGVNHAVVCKNDEIVHNPAWYKSPITGPAAIGVYIVAIIGVDA